MKTQNNVIVLARMENTGTRETGRHIRPDGVNWIPETESCTVAKSLVFSSDMSRLPDAYLYGRVEGYTVLVLPDTTDVLQVARNTIQGKKKSETTA